MLFLQTSILWIQLLLTIQGPVSAKTLRTGCNQPVSQYLFSGQSQGPAAHKPELDLHAQLGPSTMEARVWMQRTYRISLRPSLASPYLCPLGLDLFPLKVPERGAVAFAFHQGVLCALPSQ